jgi:heat shock protein HslJ
VDLLTVRAVAVLLATSTMTPAALAAEPSLTSSQWSIVQMDGKPIQGTATMDFTRLRWLSVQTPCGPVSGCYRHSGAVLTIHITGRARHELGYGSPCRGIDYQLLLGRVRTYKVEGNNLLFSNEQEKAVAKLTRSMK